MTHFTKCQRMPLQTGVEEPLHESTVQFFAGRFVPSGHGGHCAFGPKHGLSSNTSFCNSIPELIDKAEKVKADHAETWVSTVPLWHLYPPQQYEGQLRTDPMMFPSLAAPTVRTDASSYCPSGFEAHCQALLPSMLSFEFTDGAHGLSHGFAGLPALRLPPVQLPQATIVTN